MRLVEIRRVSTEDQARDDRAGLTRQAHSNRETAKRLGATIIEPPFQLTDVCRENLVSTPEWRGIRALIQAADVHIVVDDPDRLMADFGGIEILAECQRSNTLIHHPGGTLDPSSPDGQLVGVIRSILAGNELKTIRKRVQGAKEAKRREGIFPSSSISLPTGIAYERTKGERKGRWTYNERINQVRQVWRVVAEDGITNWREVGRRTGFSAVTVRNLLSNPIYMGWWVLDEKREAGPTPIRADGRRKDRRKVPRAPHEVIRVEVFRSKGEPSTPGDQRDEALVDEQTWHSVQKILESKRVQATKLRDQHSEARFTYRGFLWCAECGRPIYGRTKPKHGRSKTRRDWYACSSTQGRGSRCSTKYLRLVQVNGAVDRLFSTILSDERLAFGLLSAGEGTRHTALTAKLESAKAAVRRANEQRSKLLDLYISGAWGQAELDARRLKLEAERDLAEREAKRLERTVDLNDQEQQATRFRDILVALREFEFWTAEQRRDFLRRFFPKLWVSKTGIERVEANLPGALVGSAAGAPSESVALKVSMPWGELQAPPTLTEFGLPQQELYTSGELARALGLSSHRLRERLATGLVPKATRNSRGNPAWSLAEVRQILARQAEASAGDRWGLPSKPVYTTGEVTRALGITWGQLRYAIERGMVSAEPRRDRKGHRLWKEADVEAAAEYFGAAVPRDPC